ncbi:hypothetical protein [Streptococcus hyovaginalis]|uniref:hypothetical protein n=1 Tax=Streptococcus hyovaginalis TaxID=149015 RepID=UPI002A824A78|nr:hypothetical protein [Streptococcus hyovaginalis]MDY4511131.1 hypothetical protein [Streptococcus hyovaginalis]
MKKVFVSLSTVALLAAVAAPVFALDKGTTVNPEDHVALGGAYASEKPTLDIDKFLADGTVEITQKGESVTAPSQTSDLIYDFLKDANGNPVLDENGEATIIAKPATAPTAQGTNLKGGIDENGNGYVYGNSVTDKEVDESAAKPAAKPAAKSVAKADTAKGQKVLPKTSAVK